MKTDIANHRDGGPSGRADETAHVFVYGTLLFPEVWHRVVRGAYTGVPARIHGFSRRRIRDAPFPAAVAACLTESVRGTVYLNVSADDRTRIDRFEGSLYEKKTVACTLADGRIVPASVYLIAPSFRARVEDRAWDPEWFSIHALAAFVAGGDFE